MKRLVFFTKYTAKGSSSRYRFYQYIDSFKDDYECIIYPLLDDDYIDLLYGGKRISIFKIISCYLRRVWCLLSKIRKDDLLFVEKELFPYFPSVFELYLKKRRIKYIVDYDDAIFHNYDKSKNIFIRKLFRNKIPKVVQYASHVITGSPYLTNFAVAYNANVTEIPTSISLKKYECTEESSRSEDCFVIGWIGSKPTSPNLLLIKDALKTFTKKHKDVVVRLVGVDDKIAKTLGVAPTQWSEEKEVLLINTISVGIMPLTDNDFNKGKCGFKLIQYMACGKPTISTPLEANVKINRNKKNLHAITNQDWLSAFEQVYTNQLCFAKIGKDNKKDIATYYSVEANAPIYMSIFEKQYIKSNL